MKTQGDIWDWIWDDEAVLDPERLDDEASVDDLLDEDRSPAVVDGDVWEWIYDDSELLDDRLLNGNLLDEVEVPAPQPQIAGPALEVEEGQPDVELDLRSDLAPDAEEELEPEPETAEGAFGLKPAPVRFGAVARAGWFAALVGLAVVVGVVATHVVPGSHEGETGQLVPPTADAQMVVAWSVVDEKGESPAFVAVLTAGGLPPLALAVPPDVTINLPGQGLGTVDEAAGAGDVDLTAIAVENLLGIDVDASVAMPLGELSHAVDALGGLDLGGQRVPGGEVLDYLTTLSLENSPEERFLRWQDVLEEVLAAVGRQPAGLKSFPPELRPVLRASLPEPADLVALPVLNLGSGLFRPDVDAMEDLVAERFVGGARLAHEVRLVVLNGVGTPGIGEEVAGILVPQGYHLVASQNANTFELKETQIVASSAEDLPAANRAQLLLGVGKVLLGNQPAGLTDVTVVIGEDFPRA